MRPGYLYLQTHSDHPDLVRVLTSDFLPAAELDQQTTTIPYIARFKDLDAAKMHFHNALRRKLIDIDARLYQVPLVEAIATIEAEILDHQRVWLDPALSASKLQKLEDITAKHRLRHRRSDMIWQVVGLLAILLLLLKAMSILP